MPKDEWNVEALSEADKAAVRWLARAVPVPVAFRHGDDPDIGGLYDGNADEIWVLPPPGWGGDFAQILAHEAGHATKHTSRLNRNNKTPFNALLMAAGFLEPMEETVADGVAATISRRFGLLPGLIERRFELSMEDAPPELRPHVAHDLETAVEWLDRHAAKVDERPFEDDLKRLVEVIGP